MSSSSRPNTRTEPNADRVQHSREAADRRDEDAPDGLSGRDLHEVARRRIVAADVAWPGARKLCYEELTRVDWLSSMAFAMGSRAGDSSDLSARDRWVLQQIAERLDVIAEEAGLVAAANAHDQVISLFANASRGTVH